MIPAGANEARISDIRARLEAGADYGDQWRSVPEITPGNVIMYRVYDDEGGFLAECNNPDVAEFIASAGSDLAFLLKLLDKR